MQDILLSKLAANASDTAWAQAYSTINFYVALSVSKESTDTPIAVTGRDALEKLQREFFALDEKNLSSIKQAVSNTINSLDQTYDTSLILATIVHDVLYIVIAGKGLALIHRDMRMGIIGEGEEGKVVGFSGYLKHMDTVVLATEGFVQKFTPTQLTSYLETENIIEIAEDINPRLHEQAVGNEAALILQYTGNPEQTTAAATTSPETVETTQQEQSVIQPDDPSQKAFDSPRSEKKFPISLASLKRIRPNKRLLILVGIVMLLGLLVGGIVNENRSRQTAQNQQVLDEILGPAQKDYEDAIALESLNKPLALENLKNAQERLLSGKNRLPPGSDAEKQVDELLAKVNDEIEELQGGVQVENASLFNAGTQDDLEEISYVSLFEGSIIVGGKNGKAAEVSNNGTVQELFASDETQILDVAHDDSYVYFASGGSVYRIDRGNDDVEEIIDDAPSAANLADMHTYTGNVYVLDSSENMIYKYSGNSYSESEYFTEAADFSSEPLSFAIDNSIWVIESNGAISKFTRGVKDEFATKGVPGSFGKTSLIYTDVEYTNLYILDRDKRRLVVVGKDGMYKNQFESPDFQKASSFVVDEQAKKAYYVADNQLFSFSI